MDLAELASDLDAQRRGKIFYMMNSAGQLTAFAMRILGPDSEASKSAKHHVRDLYLKNRKVTASEEDKALIDFLCSVITGWEGLSEGGELVSFSGKKLREILTKYPVIREQAEVYAGNRQFFLEGQKPVKEDEMSNES